MDKIIKHGIQMAASFDPASQKEMRATLTKIFSEAGSQINFNTPENKKSIQALASLMRDMFASVGKGDMFDFSKMIESPEKMFKEMGSAAKEFEGVWNSIVSRMGNNSLSSIFMKNQSELSVALERMENASNTAQKRIVANMQKAFEPVKSNKINGLLEEARGLKGDFVRGENWETRTTAALRYLNVYQRIMTLTKGGFETDGLSLGMDKVLADIKNIGPYTVEQIESVKPQLQASLQNLFNLSAGKPLIGLTSGGVIDINVAPKVIKTLDVGDVLGGKTNINIPVTPEIDPAFKTKLDKLRDLYEKSNTSDDAYQEFEKLQEEMTSGLPAEMQEEAMDRLLRFAELSKVAARNYNAIWKDFAGYGMTVGDGAGFGGISTGVGGDVQAHQENTAAINEEIQAYEKLTSEVQRYVEIQRFLHKLSSDAKRQHFDAIKSNTTNNQFSGKDVKETIMNDFNETWQKFQAAQMGLKDGTQTQGVIDGLVYDLKVLSEAYQLAGGKIEDFASKQQQAFAKTTKDQRFAYQKEARTISENTGIRSAFSFHDLQKIINQSHTAEEAVQKFMSRLQDSSVTSKGIENANQLADIIQRVEAAYKELDALSNDPWNIKNEEEVNRILQERLAIIQRVGAENLKAHNPDAYAGVEYMNNEYASKITAIRESKDDDIYNKLDENFGYNNDIIASAQELELLLTKRRELMQGIHFNAEQEYLEQEQINQAIERRIALMQQLEPLVANGSITQDQLEEMVMERGTLDERRSMLEGVQQNLFNAEPEDLSEAQYVLDEYEKIMVETAGGKKLTLGPEMSEADWKAFMRMNTEKAKSIEFVRKEIQTRQENTAAINVEVQAQEKLNAAENQNQPAQDDAGVHNANADAINGENEALQQQKKIISDVAAAKEGLKASQTKLGVTDGKDRWSDRNTLDIVKEKQKELKGYLQELIQIGAQEEKNGSLTEAEVTRRRELLRLVQNMGLAVRYKDGSFYDTRDLDGMGSKLSEQIAQLNQIISLRKQITLGYYETGVYGTIGDTFSGESVSNLIDFGSMEGIEEFNSSIVGQLAREYQHLHEQMLRCMLVGEEVPTSTLDRMKWFESMDVTQLESVLPRLTELQGKIQAIQSNDFSTVVGEDEAYYDEKIKDLNTLLALQKEYMSLGGPIENIDYDKSLHYSTEELQQRINQMTSLKQGAQEVAKLKAAFPDTNLGGTADLAEVKFDLQQGSITYDEAVAKVTKLIAAQKQLNDEKTKEPPPVDDTPKLQDENAKLDEQNGKLKENINLKAQANGQGIVTGGTGTDGTGTAPTKVTPAQTVPDGATSAEAAELEAVRAKVLEVTNAVNTKTQAFFAEQKAVKSVAQSEVHALGEVEKRVNAVRVALNNLQTKQHKINLTVAGGEDISNISATEAQALTKLRAALQLTTKRVDEKTQAFNNEKAVVNNVVNSEVNALNRLNTQVDAVNKTVMTLLQNIQSAKAGMATGVISQIQTAVQGQLSGGQQTVTSAGGNLLKMYERLGALGVQKNALDPNSAERKGIEEKIRLLQEEIKQKLKLVSVDKQLIAEAKKKGAANQKAQMMTVGGRKSDTQAVKDEKTAIDDLLGAYERLGVLRAKRDMLPKGANRDELQKEIKSETSRLWKRAKALGVDSTQTSEASDRGAHSVMMDQLIEKTKLLGQYKKDIISMDKGSEAYNNAQNQINRLTSEIALIQKKITLTQEEKLELDALIQKNAELAQNKTSGQQDKAMAERAAQIEKLKGKYAKLGEAQANAEYKGTNEAKERFKVLAQEMAEKKQSLQLTQQELDILREMVAEAYKKQNGILAAGKKDKDKKERLADEKKKYQKQAMVGKAGSAVGRAENTLITAFGLSSQGKDAIPAEFKQQVDEYHVKLEKLRQTQARLQKMDGPIRDEDQKDLIKQINDVNKLTGEISNLVSQYQRLSGTNSTVIGQDTLGDGVSLSQYRQQLEQAVRIATNGKAQIKGFDNETGKLTYTVKTGKNEFTEYTAEVRQLDHQLVATQGPMKKTETFLESTKRKMKEISSYMSGMVMFSRIWQELRRGIQYVGEIDLALTELKKVTDETEETYDKFLDTAAKTGARLGSTISAVTEATSTFAKLGYSMEQATKMAEAAIVYKNVGDNIASTEDAADSIISTMKGFGLEASESMAIIDRFNEVGNRFAITSQGIGEALRLSASALNEGGNSLDESIGLITAANEVVNDPSSVGTALKTLTLRLRGSKTELEEMGEDVSDMATTTSQLQAKLLALTGGQVDIMLDENTFKNSTQILREMAAAWEDMTDIQRASALELMGGKRQANVLSALIQNFDTVEKVIETSANSAGSALEENERYLDSIQGKIDQFNNAMQSLWNNLLSSDVVKGFVGWGTKVIKSLDTVQGKILALVKVLAIFMAYKKINPLDWLSNIGTFFATIKDTGVKQYIASLLGIAPAMKAVTAETVANTIALQTNDVVKTKQIMSEMGLAGATGALSSAQKEQAATAILNAMSTGQLTMAQGNAMLAMLGYAGATVAADGSLKVLDATTKSFMASNPIGWILAIVSALMTVIMLLSKIPSETERLEKKLSDLNSEISDLNSEIDSLNSELETTQDRMEELLSKDSLSFVEEEELKNLKLQNELLEKKIKLSNMLLKNKQQEAQRSSEDIIDASWNGANYDKKYNIAYFAGGSTNGAAFIQRDTALFGGKSGKEALDISIESYKNRRDKADADDALYTEVLDWMNTHDGRLSDELVSRVESVLGEEEGYFKKVYGNEEGAVEKGIKTRLENIRGTNEAALRMQEDGIDMVMGDLLKTIPEDYEYGTSDIIDQAIDDLNAYGLRYENAKGTTRKSEIIHSIFGADASEELQQLKSDLQDIAESEDDVNKKTQKAQKLIDTAYNSMDKGYKRLKNSIDIVGISTEELASVFIAVSEGPDISTIEGVTEVYQDGVDILGKYKDARDEVLGQDENGEDITWDNLFTQDESGKKVADKIKIASILEGSDEAIREEFTKMIEAVENGEMEVDEAFVKWNMSGFGKVLDNLNNEFESVNNEIFANIADDITGLIDTISELQAALEDVANTMDLLSTAEEQMANSGQISVKTALDLMATTDDYNKVVTVESGVLKLATGAQEYLTQAKFNSIKTQLEASATLAENTYQTALASNTELDYADNANVVMTAESIKAEAIGRVSAVIVALGAAMDEITKGNWGSAFSAFGSTYTSATDTVVAQSNAMKTSISELERDAKNKRALADVYSFADGYNNFRDNYDFDKTPGDKYDTDGSDAASEAFQKAMDYWENRISANQARYEQLQNEIDLLESKGQKADASYYEEQIKLENERLSLLQQQKAEAQKFLGTFTEGSDEWFRKKPA